MRQWAPRVPAHALALLLAIGPACQEWDAARRGASAQSSARSAPASLLATTRLPEGIRLPEGTKLVDLTYTFDETTIYWPTAPSKFVLTRLHHGPTEAGHFYAANTLATPEHGGTHFDAPIHFGEGKPTVEKVALERLVAPGIVIDMSEAAKADADALLGVAHIDAFEKEHGKIEPGAIVLVRTGWGSRWPDRKRYLGDDTEGDASKLHFPGIGKDAAERLVERKVAAVGIDTASIDHGPSKDFIAHQVLLGAEIPAFENVARLEEIPERGALIIALPMKIGGGSGAPLRIVAVVARG
jgi:kynurenine formamidase